MKKSIKIEYKDFYTFYEIQLFLGFHNSRIIEFCKSLEIKIEKRRDLNTGRPNNSVTRDQFLKIMEKAGYVQFAYNKYTVMGKAKDFKIMEKKK